MRWITNAVGLSAFLLSLTLLFEAWPGAGGDAESPIQVAIASFATHR